MRTLDILPTIALSISALALIANNMETIRNVPKSWHRFWFQRFHGRERILRRSPKSSKENRASTLEKKSTQDFDDFDVDDDDDDVQKHLSVEGEDVEEEEENELEKRSKIEKRKEERRAIAEKKGFEMITIRASWKEDEKKRDRFKTKKMRKKKIREKKSSNEDGTSSTDDEDADDDKRIEVDISTFGATIVALRVPDRTGECDDIVLGFNSVEEYASVDEHPYFGAVVGRVANRIKGGKYTLDGVEYKCDRNDNLKHTLHGGMEGLDVKRWTLKDVSDSHCELTCISGDLEAKGFPGNCRISVIYRVRIIERARVRERKKQSIYEEPSCEFYIEKFSSLTCEFKATTDAKTPICLAQHSYFNLSGCDSNEDVGYHLAKFPNVSKYLVLDDECIPTGEIRKVHEAFDFTEKRLVFSSMPPLVTPLGFDHNFCIDGENSNRSVKQRPARYYAISNDENYRSNDIPSTRFSESLVQCAYFESASTGRTMDVYTDAPGFQFYTGNFLDGKTKGKNGVYYERHTGFCVETQWWPNAVNEKSTFPDCVLEPGKVYVHNTSYEFGVVKKSLGEGFISTYY